MDDDGDKDLVSSFFRYRRVQTILSCFAANHVGLYVGSSPLISAWNKEFSSQLDGAGGGVLTSRL